MFYLIYKITNTITGKIYIGAHRTSNINDGYMGSGKYIKRSIEKHGIEAFTKEILFVFDNAMDMWAKEAELVTEKFIGEPNTYNLKVGGNGGFDQLDRTTDSHITAMKKGRKITNQTLLEKYGEDWHTIISEKGRAKSRIVLEELRKNPEFVENQNKHREKGRQQALTDEAKQKRKATMTANGHSQGEKNSQFGTRWITNPTTKENKKIKSQDLSTYLSTGWILGRITY